MKPGGLEERRRATTLLLALLLLLPSSLMGQGAPSAAGRTRAPDIGLDVGIFHSGPLDAITDVEGVRVGQTTRIEGDRIRTGVTAILPHPGNVFLSKVPAALYVGNGFGKLLGVTQVRELGEIETPILLTCTLCVWKAADALTAWMLARDGMEDVRSINPVVGETNDGGLNDIRARPLRPEDVRHALETASSGPVEEGSVGAGTGTQALGWKGGIGTSSRILPDALGGYRVGVLVQTNYGGILTMNGAPVGKELGRYSFKDVVEGDSTDGVDRGQGSVMIVVATDAPLSSRNLERVARRAILGIARTGSFAGNGSGDYVIAFSTAQSVRRPVGQAVRSIQDLANDRMSGLFEATVEATEEAVYNSLLQATTITGIHEHTADALPIDRTLEILRRYHAVKPSAVRP